MNVYDGVSQGSLLIICILDELMVEELLHLSSLLLLIEVMVLVQFQGC